MNQGCQYKGWLKTKTRYCRKCDFNGNYALCCDFRYIHNAVKFHLSGYKVAN